MMSRFDPVSAIEHLAHYVPSQGPIQDFIHHNTLHAFQDKPFHEAVRAAAGMYGARAYMPAAFYAEAWGSGRIRPESLQAAARALGRGVQGDPGSLGPADPRPAGIAAGGLRAGWREILDAPMEGLTRPLLFRLIAAFLDQGVSEWKMPYAERPFFEAVRAIVGESAVPLPPFDDPRARELLAMAPEAAIAAALRDLVGDESLFERYLTETALGHPGWSGMVRQVELNPEALLHRRSVRLLEFLALELVLEAGWARRKLGDRKDPFLAERAEALRGETGAPAPDAAQAWDTLAFWQEAFEWSYYDSFFEALRAKKGSGPSARPPAYQALFCIDDRECSVRRHLEETIGDIATYAAAGFFNVDAFFQRAGEHPFSKQAPLPVSPRHVIREKPRAAGKPRHELRPHLAAGSPSDTLTGGWLSSLAYGPLRGAALLVEQLFPHRLTPAHAAGYATAQEFDLAVAADGGDAPPQALSEGYTLDEMAARVKALLSGIGATRAFAPLFFVFGHGHSSTNNVYFAAYDCGACSGRSGAPNARAVARMANHPAVRARLRAEGIDLPASTWFVGGVHDTTRDEATFYDEDLIPESHLERYRGFRAKLETALALNARERCRRFALVREDITPEQAIREVRSRSTALAEPRPELNHANNAACVVGRRSLTRGGFFDRRAFLNSYDPESDPEGKTLQGILNAVVPVCGGINLEYYFSRMDPERYGAGSKLAQNVVGLLGVQNGPEGDLLTGLPIQMTELHEPVRLLMLVEQRPEVALQAARANPRTWEWIANGWIRYFCIEPSSGAIHWFDGDSFVRYR